MDSHILKLFREIENQLSHDAKGTGYENPQVGLVSLQTEGREYFAGLWELRDQIISKLPYSLGPNTDL